MPPALNRISESGLQSMAYGKEGVAILMTKKQEAGQWHGRPLRGRPYGIRQLGAGPSRISYAKSEMKKTVIVRAILHKDDARNIIKLYSSFRNSLAFLTLPPAISFMLLSSCGISYSFSSVSVVASRLPISGFGTGGRSDDLAPFIGTAWLLPLYKSPCFQQLTPRYETMCCSSP